MKLLLDMNLPPLWCEWLKREGHEATHWSVVGDAGASDRAIIDWAKRGQHVVVTHDLGFGTLMAARGDTQPSVVILRSKSASTPGVFAMLCRVLVAQKTALDTGAIVIIEQGRSRVRILPLR